MTPSKTTKKKAGSIPARPKKEAARKEVHSLEPVDAPALGQSNGQPQSQPQEGRYLYGVIEARDNVGFGKIGIGGMGESVYCVQHCDVAGAVSKTPVFILDPTRANPPAPLQRVRQVM